MVKRVILGVLGGLLTIGVAVLVPENAKASTDIDIQVTPILEMSLSSLDMAVQPDGELRMDDITLNVISNNRTGFVATMTMTKNADETGATSLNHAVVSGVSIPALDASSAANDFPANHWGASLDSGATFSAVPARDETGLTVLSTSGVLETNNANITIGTKLGGDTTSGRYENSILVTVVANYVPLPLSESYLVAGKTKVRAADGRYYYSMQDMDDAVCNGADLLDTSVRAVDIRDGKVYWIAKLQDGHCWMTQNLDLNLSPNIALTSETSNLVEFNDAEGAYTADGGYSMSGDVISWTPLRATVDAVTTGATPGSVDGWVHDQTSPSSADAGDWYWIGNPFYSSPECGYSGNQQCDYIKKRYAEYATRFTETKSDATNFEHGHVGNYYNWTASIATNNSAGYHVKTDSTPVDNPQNSICPKGWRLPTRSSQDTSEVGSTNEYGRLVLLYNKNLNNTSEGLEKSPFYAVRSGYLFWDRGDLFSAGEEGRYWLSTVSSNDNGYAGDFSFGPGRFTSVSSSNCVNGYPIRCIASSDISRHTLSFDVNGGVGAPASIVASGSTNATIMIPMTIPTKSGFSFKGWATTDGATTAEYAYNGSIFTPSSIVISEDTTLYAVWGQADLSSITYMQEMTPELCAATPTPSIDGVAPERQLVDTRDGKTYWVAKLADGHCWMTQNLDYNIIAGTPITSETTNLKQYGVGAYTSASGYAQDGSTGVISWTPTNATINAVTSGYVAGSITGWANSGTAPYSVDPGDWYWRGSTFYPSTDCGGDCDYISKSNIKYASHFINVASDLTNYGHGQVGNYYNWTAAIASNNSSAFSENAYSDVANSPKNSICPKGWRLPTISDQTAGGEGSTDEFRRLNVVYNNNSTSSSEALEKSPVFAVRAGYVYGGALYAAGSDNYLWSSTLSSGTNAYYASFSSAYIGPESNYLRDDGFSIRCVAE